MKRSNLAATTALGIIGLILVGIINIFLNVLFVTFAVFSIITAINDTTFWNVFWAAWLVLISVTIIRQPVLRANQS